MLTVVRRIELRGPAGVRWVPAAHRGAGALVLAGSSAFHAEGIRARRAAHGRPTAAAA
jgi:hypothetical protein